MTFSSFYNGSKNGNFFLVEIGKDELLNLTVGVLHHFFSGNIAVRFTGSGEKESQKIVNLSYGSNGRSRIFTYCFLFNGDNRT